MTGTLNEAQAFARHPECRRWISRLQLQTRLCAGYRQIRRITDHPDFPKPHVLEGIGTRWLISDIEEWERSR